MRIQSFATGTIFWRAFNPDDPLCAVGLAEGKVQPGQFANFNHPSKHLKLELKVGDLHGALIMAPGRVLDNGDGVDIFDDHFVVQTHVFIPVVR